MPRVRLWRISSAGATDGLEIEVGLSVRSHLDLDGRESSQRAHVLRYVPEARTLQAGRRAFAYR